MGYGKETRKQLRELVAKAHDCELNLYIAELETSFDEWREGKITPSQLSGRIHEFHDGSSRAVYKTYTILKRDQLVARAIGIGLLKEEEVSDEIMEMFSGDIYYFREHYEIDDDDPLAKLRKSVSV